MEIQWVHERSFDVSERILRTFKQRGLSAARTLGLDEALTARLLDEQVATVRQETIGEQGYLVIRTLPTILAPSVVKHAHRNRNATIKKTGFGTRISANTQPIIAGLVEMTKKHETQVRLMCDLLSRHPLNLVARIVEKHDAIRVISRMYDPEPIRAGWKPRLPGDPVDRRMMPNGAVREWHPLLAAQMFRTPMVNVGSVVKIGQRWAAPIMMMLPPHPVEAFSELMRRVPKEYEWRYSITIVGGALQWLGKVKTRRFWTTLIKMLNSSHNGMVIESADTLIELATTTNEQLCGLRVTGMVLADNRARAIERQGMLLRYFQAWGSPDVVIEEGGPGLLVLNNLPGLDKGQVAPTLITPMREAVAMLPLGRTASPWADSGTVIYRTHDRAPYPFREGSSQQSYAVTLLFAPPGSGKSVMLNLLNFAACLTPGLARLPKIAILDIGPSSKGLIDLLKALLPPSRQHEAEYYVLRDTKESAINPFDTLLGSRYPTATERGFLANFLALLLTPAGAKEPPPMTGEYASSLIDEAYRYYDQKAPKLYEEALEPDVDHLLAQYPDLLERAACSDLAWWDIVDRFMENGYYREAGLAQRNAVPLALDLPMIVSESQSMQDAYGQGDLMQKMLAMLQSVIRDYPLLTAPTRFNPAEARVVAVDLMEAAKSSSGYERKRAGLIYMLGRHALAREFYADESSVEYLPPVPRAYHRKRLRDERATLKRLVYDEFHRTSSLSSIREQVKQDAREGRKYKVQVALASQLYGDFDADLRELASALFVLKADNDMTRQHLAEEFSLNDAAQYALRHLVHGASSEGASFLLWARLKQQAFTQTLICKIGPMLLWAFSTTPEDAALRDRLADRIGYGKAITILADQIPSGSISDEIERMEVLTEDDTIEQYIEQRAESLTKLGNVPGI